METCFRHDRAAEEDIRPFHRVHIDFESFSKQNLAGKQVRIHPGYVKYLLQGYFHVAILTFNCDMDGPSADAKQLSLRHVDFNRFIEGFVVDQDVFVRREVFRGTRIEDPIELSWISAVPITAAEMGLSGCLSRPCRCVEGYLWPLLRWMPCFCPQMGIFVPTCRFDAASLIAKRFDGVTFSTAFELEFPALQRFVCG